MVLRPHKPPPPAELGGGAPGRVVGLGNIGVNCCTPEELKGNQRLTPQQLREVKALQREISVILSVKNCGRHMIPLAEEVKLMKYGENRAGFTGLQSCKGKFCISCQRHHRQKLIDEVDQALWEVEKLGGTVLMGVLTCSNDGLEVGDQLELLHSSWRSLLNRRPMGRLLEELGYIGAVRGDDVMIHPVTGRCHPHMHVALAFEKELTQEEIARLRDYVVSTWCAKIEGLGGRAIVGQQRLDRAVGREVDGGGQARYMAKGVAHEVTNGLVKVGKNGSLSMFGLLVRVYFTGLELGPGHPEVLKLIALYQYVESQLKRRRTVSVSRRLQELAESAEPLEPAEKEEEAEPELLVALPKPVYWCLVVLKVSSITPMLCLVNPAFLERLRSICEGYRRMERARAGPQVVFSWLESQIRGLYGIWVGKGALSQAKLRHDSPRLPWDYLEGGGGRSGPAGPTA